MTVSEPPTALHRLTDGLPEFAASVFGRRPMHFPRVDAGGFQDLLSLSDVDHLVTSTGLRTPAFRLVRHGTTLPRSTVTKRARIGSKPVDDLVDVASVRAEFAAGASIVLQGLHRSWGPVGAFCRSLEAELTHPVQANAYLTPPVAQGLDLHEDRHDVFALQTHGVKRWVVHPGNDEEPWDLQLRPGDVLYLPAGTRHAAQTTDQPSLHLTLGVRTVTWGKVLREVVDRMLAAADQAELGEPLPVRWAEDPTSLAREVEERFTSLLQGSGDDGVSATALAALADRFWQGSPPDLSGSIVDVLELPALDDTTRLRVRAGAVCRLREHDGRLEVTLADRRLRTPLQLAPALHRILELHRFLPKELDGVLDEPSRLVLARRLVREGLLTIDRDPTHG